jgi:hypothetical protein
MGAAEIYVLPTKDRVRVLLKNGNYIESEIKDVTLASLN